MRPIILLVVTPTLFAGTLPSAGNAWEAANVIPPGQSPSVPAPPARAVEAKADDAPSYFKVEFRNRDYRQGTVTAVTKDSITVVCPESLHQTEELDANKVRRWVTVLLPALPPKRFAVSKVLASGGVPKEPRGAYWVSVMYMYRLADVQVGDWVCIKYARVDGVDICDHINIAKRPGGRIPPLPPEVKERSRIPYHELRNAHWDLEDKGIPYPESFAQRGSSRRFPVAPPPREVPLTAAVAAPAPPETELTKLARAYGTWTDPCKDATFKLTGGELKVSLPAADRLFGMFYEGARNDAPRALREVEGDFTAVVRVASPISNQLPEKYSPHSGGGLVAWESEAGFFAVQLANGQVNGNREAIWGQHSTATEWQTLVKGLGTPTGKAFVRLKREGQKVTAGWSRDGKQWKDFDAGPQDVTWGPKVKVGVVAENNLGVPVEVTFDQYSLTQPKK